MRRMSVLITLFVLGLILAGCPPKKVIQPEPSTSVVTPQKIKEEAFGASPEEMITEEQIVKIDTKDIGIPNYIEESGAFEDIYFDFDNYDIQPNAKPTLKIVSDWMLKNPATKIFIEGHCCEIGTNEYNLALGDRRARATRDYLVALGVASDRIEMISYGEENPLCSESKAEACLKKNRRSHFVVIK
jgi:peptidoglycan-associated lipoprotein